MTLARPTRAACPGIEKIGFNAKFHGKRARHMPRKSRRPGRAKKQQAQRRPSAANTAPRGAASAPREANGAWLSLESNLNRSARQAFDSTVTLLSRGGGDDDGYDDEVHIPERTDASCTRGFTREPSREPSGASQGRVSTKRKRITPFQAKRVAARQHWRLV
jgi:hypothetical protein